MKHKTCPPENDHYAQKENINKECIQTASKEYNTQVSTTGVQMFAPLTPESLTPGRPMSDKTLPSSGGVSSEDKMDIGMYMNSRNGYVLDIDLDFFSTTDPFKAMFSKKQHALLKDIYTFEKPRDNSKEVSYI